MRIRKKVQAKTEISTASMPDVVFLLLFFFMVSATIKQQHDQVKTKIPLAHALTKIDKQFLIREIHVGKLTNENMGSGFKISVENRIIVLRNGAWGGSAASHAR